MSHTIPHKPLLLATAMGLASMSAGPAQALTSMEIEEFNFNDSLYAYEGNPDYYDDENGNGDTLYFDLFDPSMGTLQQVEIELISNVYGDQDIDAYQYSTGYYGYGGRSTLDVDLSVDVNPLGADTFTFQQQYQVDCTINGSDYCYDYDTFNDPFNDTFLVDTDGGNLADFIGLGEFSVDLNVFAMLSCDFLGDAYSCSTTSNFNWAYNSPGTIKVTYTYELASVPEPAPLFLIGGGIAALGLVRRKRAIRSG